MGTTSENSEFPQEFRPNGGQAPDLKVVDGVVADPFDDLDSLKCPQDFAEGATKKLLTRVPVRRPRSTDWFMVHRDRDYRGDFKLAENKDESESYLIAPHLYGALEGEPTVHRYTLFTAINRNGTVFLYPVRLQEPDGKWNSWHRSQHEAAELAMKGWLRMTSNKDIGGYDLREAIANFAKPDWGDLPPFNKLVRIAFRDFLIDNVEHVYLKRLRGEI
jgi:hypothetical protein